MTPWFLTDFARLARERAEISQLVATADWLTGAEWIIEGGHLVVNFDLRVHDFDYELRLEYPALFSSVPAVVLPRKADARLSGHQYGPGGPLCLEYRPDNWTSDVTGAQLIESAYRLLSTENPSGVAAGQRGGIVESAHAVTIGQELRTSGRWLRLFVAADAAAFLSTRTAAERGEAALALRNHRNCAVFFIRSLRFGDVEYGGKIPSDRALATSPVNARALTTHLSASEVRSTKAAAAFGSHVTEEDLAAEWLIVISAEATAHLFLKLDDGQLLPADTVLQDSAAAERTPNQYQSLGDRRVALIGAGSLGTKVGISLARMGVRRFMTIDDDILLPENLERNGLDWTGVGHHKASALAEAIERVAPTAVVDDRRVRLTGQESSAVIAALVAKIAECDIIIDATANPSNFNIAAAAATTGRKPLVWAEVYGGGKGGAVSRSAPNVDPPPHVVRHAYLRYCEINPGPAVAAAGYDLPQDAGVVLSASDADVSVIASHTVRIAADVLVNEKPEHEYPVYLIGFSKWWVFDAPFDTRPLSIPREEWPEAAKCSEEKDRGCDCVLDRPDRETCKMILRLPATQRAELVDALQEAGEREIGGILMGEHVDVNEFRVASLTIQRRSGTIARFVRIVEHAVTALTRFFRETGNDFTRFNYLGEWHSHPLFTPYPSSEDHVSMMKILWDEKVGANFVVLIVAKMVDGELVTTGTLYTRSSRCAVTLVIE
jgi:sulfur-carrier protein adenylyltransferase/sulfurtransferase